MNEKMTQNQRLDYLVEEFKTDSVQYKDLETPKDTEGKRRILRSLMNIRMPKAFSYDVLAVQDEYLTGRAEEKGIVRLSDIPEICDGLSIWQGDITRLAVDVIVNATNSQMLGCFVPMHTCIDNCIHTFAGVQLRAECSRQMNQLRLVRELSAGGNNKDQIASALKLKPFIAGKLMNQARAFQVVQLKRYVALCVETEEAVKTGQMGEKLAVETVLIQIARRK